MTARGRRRFALESLAFSYAAVVFAVVQGVLLVPIYLIHIPEVLYGAWLATGSVLAWIELADPGLSVILQQKVAFRGASEGEDALGRLVGTGMVAAMALAPIPMVGCLAAAPLAAWIGLPPGLQPQLAEAFMLGLGSASLSTLVGALTAVCLGLQEVRRAGVVSLAGLLVGVAVTVVALMSGIGVLALPLGSLARGLVGVIGMASVVHSLLRRRGVKLSTSLVEARGLALDAGYTLTGRIGTVVLTRLDAVMSAKMLSPTATVVLALTGKAIDVVRLGADRIGTAAMPALASLAGERGAGAAHRVQGLLAGYAALVLGVLGGTVVVWNGDLVRLWVGEPRYGGLALTLALATYGCLAALAATLVQSVLALGGVRETSVIALVEAGVRLALQFLLVKSLGLAGFPVAAIGAVVLVSLPLLMNAAARRLGGGIAVQARALARQIAPMVALLMLGAGASAALTWWRPAWPGLLFASTGTAAALFLLSLLLFPEVRQDLSRVLAGRRHR